VTVQRTKVCIGLGFTLGALAGCGGGSAGPAPPVNQVARKLVTTGFFNAPRSAIVFVEDGKRTFAAAYGPPARSERRFRVGSITKTFTAAIALQLVHEGKLRLSDPVSRYLPGLIPAARHITIRELLDHQSGLANYTDDSRWLSKADRSTSMVPRDAVRFAVSQRPAFRAGTSWAYSNTNYITLGLVIEKVTGHSYAEELSQRILEPLKLKHTELATVRRPADLTDTGTNPNWPWAAGGIVSDAADIAHFYGALLSGKLLDPTELSAMKQTVGPGDGLGFFGTDAGCGRVWGHEGDILDYQTFVDASDDGQRVTVISLRAGPHGFAGTTDVPLGTLLCPGEWSRPHGS
jgi:D-alanyl-D-alanine carboxypeptidase